VEDEAAVARRLFSGQSGIADEKEVRLKVQIGKRLCEP
jgi:hypothetical protein